MLPHASSISKPARILLVEDDEIFLYAIKSLLTNAGYEVLATSGFDLALRYLEGNEKIDLFITDIVMPVNGIALARMARLRRRELPVIYFTAYDIPNIDGEALGEILRKPFEDVHLLNAVKAALQNDTNDLSAA